MQDFVSIGFLQDFAPLNWRMGFMSLLLDQGIVGGTLGPTYPYGKSLYKPYIVGTLLGVNLSMVVSGSPKRW